MFDGGVTLVGEDEAAASYELEWMAVHRTLCELARTRNEHDATEATYLLEAEDLHVFKRLGYRTMVDYMVGELDWTKHAANERLRVSRELLRLPKLAAAYSAGELCFSKLRELTRVVTPETEEAFLVEAGGKNSHQVAKLVSGLKRGDQPDAVPDPALVTRRMGFELHGEALGLLVARRAALAAVLGRAPTDDEFIIALCTTVGNEAANDHAPGIEIVDQGGPTGDRKVSPPRTQQLILTCKQCARSELVVAGEALALDEATLARLTCDVEILGDADTDERTRVSSNIPAALRRKVFARDKFCCVVPGCTSTKYLDVHHIRHREHGGKHVMRNLCLLCFHHHKAHHDGKLVIEGTAPHRLVFRWSHVGPHDERVELHLGPADGSNWRIEPAHDQTTERRRGP